MRKFGFETEHGTTFEYGIRFLDFPEIDSGTEIIDDKSIPGRAGTLSVRTGKYTDTVITNSMEFSCGSLNEYGTKLEAIKRWLQKTKRVSYTDDEDNFYIVKKVEISVKRKHGYFGQISVKFICEPFVYLKQNAYINNH
jgi:phage-related protein